MPLERKDFIEVEFTGKVKDGEIFDSNIEEDLKKISPDSKSEPFIFSLGEGMFLPAIDDFLIGKEIGEYNLELPPERAFGKRDTSMIQRIPLRIFKEQKINPIPGFIFNFDGRIGKVLASSGGRVIVDFNNPIAGKDVIYKIKVLRRIEDLNEKAKALVKFLFRADIKFEIKDNKIIFEAEKPLVEFIKIFKDKFREILGLELEVKEIERKPEDSTEIKPSETVPNQLEQ